jgi:putative peptidoglycan lipid II flippase
VSKHLKNIGILSLLTLVSRVLGLFRDALAAAVFGVTAYYSAYLTAFTLPNLFRRLLAEGSLTAAFIPTLQEELHRGGKPATFALLSKVSSWLLLVSGGIAGLAMLVFSHSRAIPGLQARWYLAGDLTVILFPYLALIALAAAFNASLNVLERFTEPALSPIWLNLAMIAALAGAGLHLAHSRLGEIHWLCAGVLVGGSLQMLVPAAILVREGWRPRFDLELSPGVRQIVLLMTPGVFGTAIYQINISVSRLLANGLSDSAVALYFNANRLMEFPLGVFAVAVSTVVYPLIARHAVADDRGAMAVDFRKGLRLILIINVPAAVGLMLLSHPIVSLIYRHGVFTAANARAQAQLVALFAIGLPFFSVANLTIRAFYAVKDTATPVKIGAIDFGINVAVSLVLMRWLGVAGLVVASTTAIIVQTLLLQRALARRLPELRFGPLAPSLAKVLAAAAVMGAGVAAGWRLVQRLGLGPRWTPAVAVLGLIPAAIAVYGALLWALRIEGREELAALWDRLRSGAARRGAR